MGIFSVYSLSWNGEVRYIGYTSKSIQERLTTHWEARKKKGCHRACWLYSLPNKPEITLLLLCATIQEAHRLERGLIRYHRSIGTRLTNATDGGDGYRGGRWSADQYEVQSQKVDQYTKDGTLIAVHNSLSDAARSVAGNAKNNGKISAVCRGKRGRRTFMGFVFRYHGDAFDKHPVEGQWNVTEKQKESIRRRQSDNNVMAGRIDASNPKSRAVIQISLLGEQIREFPSMSAVTRELGISWVSQAVRSGGIAGGYYWKYKEDIVQSSQ